jgi:high-affinity nickel-transport protein
MENAMPTLANGWIALALLALVLGMKHGLDADHLATIDGLTRFNADRPRLARWCGTFFSLGHGAVVIGVALGTGAAARAWQVPQALEAIGAWISIGFLAALGLANLRAVLAARPGELVRPLGIKAGFFGRMQRIRHPIGMVAVGALFAVSFDTISQAGLIAMTATGFGGVAPALALGALFTFGMLAVDGLNGLWVARLLARADARARFVSRAMGLAIAALSLALAAWGALRQISPRLDAWNNGNELVFGAGIIAALAATFLLSVSLATRRLTHVKPTVGARSYRVPHDAGT